MKEKKEARAYVRIYLDGYKHLYAEDLESENYLVVIDALRTGCCLKRANIQA